MSRPSRNSDKDLDQRGIHPIRFIVQSPTMCCLLNNPSDGSSDFELICL